jgi:hypothetical protein
MPQRAVLRLQVTNDGQVPLCAMAARGRGFVTANVAGQLHLYDPTEAIVRRRV